MAEKRSKNKTDEVPYGDPMDAKSKIRGRGDHAGEGMVFPERITHKATR